MRLLHHFACTGGTLIAKCLAALPNTLLLSEIDPLSRLRVNPHNPHFAPSDLILHLHYSLRGVEDEDIVAVFLGGLAALLDRCDRVGRRLVLRDHAHSQFCHGPQIPDRPTLAAIVGRLRPVRGVLTVREPMESYLSLLAENYGGGPVGVETIAADQRMGA
ncbi:hypothetical protein, partial [Stenotrophomonas sp.]|uniref:hypothetical protein n=1 Tax=Stenotrophomonas sp. TaxID=69392 RepID=UPI0019BC5797